MLSLPEVTRVWGHKVLGEFASVSRLGDAVDRHLKNALLAEIAEREFTCPRCRQAPGKECKMMLFGRWRTGFDAYPPVHKERLVAAITVYGD
jgi:hypothetical protein